MAGISFVTFAIAAILGAVVRGMRRAVGQDVLRQYAPPATELTSLQALGLPGREKVFLGPCLEREGERMSWPTWAGDIPTWVTTVAVGFAGAQLLVDRRRAAEENREAKAQASKLSAWAVSDRSAEPLICGVVVSNRSSSTFHDVSIVAVVHHKRIDDDIHFAVLPPGEFFVEFSKRDGWQFAIEAAEHGRSLRPYTRTDGYNVQSIAFTDNLEQRWSADAHMVLARVARVGTPA